MVKRLTKVFSHRVRGIRLGELVRSTAVDRGLVDAPSPRLADTR